MLLYTRVAPPKVPKKRSRAGCTFCKEKKKKCDEHRPCSRCSERNLECTYEAVKPRQRKKPDSQSSLMKRASTSDPSGDEEWHLHDTTDDSSDVTYIGPVDISVDSTPLFADELVMTPAAEDVEGPTQDLVRVRSSLSSASTSHQLSLPPDLAMIAPCPVPSPIFEFCMPVFTEFSDRSNRRGLVNHFCNVLSHLIVLWEESGNPFNQLVLPLAYGSPPVMNAIYALASAHLEYRGVETGGEKSFYFHNEAIQGLAHLIEKGGKVNRKDELLAAIMLLVYYEVLVQKGRSNIVDGHLKGALTIMSSSQQNSSPAGTFLERAFRFYDVITALSLGTAPLSSAPAAGRLTPCPLVDIAPASSTTNVDNLLGMATTLWPIMHRLSNLLSLKAELENALKRHQSSKVAVLRTEFEATSQAIEVALKRWQPSLPPQILLEDGTLKNTDGEELQNHPLSSILHNALAYRHSAFVYLYRTIYGYLPGHEVVQKHGHEALVHCVQAVAFRGPMGALLWPLFVAACEAISPEDRKLAEQAFVEIDMHQGMINIDNAWGVVREVWKQLDILSVTPYGARDADLWRRVSKEMGVSIVFG